MKLLRCYFIYTADIYFYAPTSNVLNFLSEQVSANNYISYYKKKEGKRIMDIIIRKYKEEELPAMLPIWNKVVEEANAFPQIDPLSYEEAVTFFAAQTLTAVAILEGEVVGLYILHPNNIGRCGHIANASYAVKGGLRGKKIGEALVRDSLQKAKENAFTIMQFNAVVSTNQAAIHLYEKIGFQRLGVIPGGFQLNDKDYSDIVLFYFQL